ncbi:MAG: hypothetical protein A2428_02815 [Bdellovibrionales bacterium RIFOXYC1_FULL_54_43]|nr:MAG: hypothetical protein A2428_02815 [Bdellovibrionales bacterium RIFOXYC1_FULL_54_43]OFZ81032.1 MAG: hypothetical protein A2603_04625 [Bdellovibrionales bacterium RIFOXYD1_FULL_55_31]
MRSRSALRAFAFIGALTFATAAHAEILDLPTFDLNQVLPPSAVKEIIKTLGILTNHRSYQGAAPLGNTGLDLGIEATLVHLPEGFAPALSEAGMGGAGLTSGSLPMTKLHFHKGMGKTVDFGASGLYYSGNYIWGVDLKFVLVEPEEGLTWAFRFGYSETKLDMSRFAISGIPIKVGGVEIGQGSLKLATRTLTPQLLASRRLDFAEPYFGMALEMTSGQIQIPVSMNVLEEKQTMSSAATSASEVFLFTGVSFRIPNAGLRLCIEGGYGTLGMHALGLVVGLSF